VTKLAHIHFPANAAAAEASSAWASRRKRARWSVSAASTSSAKSPGAPMASRTRMAGPRGVGAHIDVTQPFLLVNQHPVTTEFGQGKDQIWETLLALDELRIPHHHAVAQRRRRIEDIATGMRTFREKYHPEYIRFYKNFPIETYVR
jgi:hypothetical protein